MVAVCAVLASAVAFVLFLVAAAAQLLSVRRSGRPIVLGLIFLAGAAGLAIIPFVASPLAEHANHWVDADHNGVLDPLVNGSYDWVDINGGDWARFSGAMGALVVGATLAAVWTVGRRSASPSPRR